MLMPKCKKSCQNHVFSSTFRQNFNFSSIEIQKKIVLGSDWATDLGGPCGYRDRFSLFRGCFCRLDVYFDDVDESLCGCGGFALG